MIITKSHSFLTAFDSCPSASGVTVWCIFKLKTVFSTVVYNLLLLLLFFEDYNLLIDFPYLWSCDLEIHYLFVEL